MKEKMNIRYSELRAPLENVTVVVVAVVVVVVVVVVGV